MSADTVEQGTEYLIVDCFLCDFLGAQVLAYALECGLIDSLLDNAEYGPDLDAQGSQLLYGILQRDGVLEELDGKHQLTEKFKKAIRFRDLLEAKLAFSATLAPDVIDGLSALLADPDAFFAESSLFSLFDYSRALEVNSENLALTRRWVELTTALTRYEGSALLHHPGVDTTAFHEATRWLDVGGNSGEFALQLVQRYPSMTVTIVDLPVVCALGREHVRSSREADRIRFLEADAVSDTMPEANDVVSFKSMLHDWPAPVVEILLGKAFDALKSGGQLLIFERAQLDWRSTSATFGNIATQLFFRSYKTSDFYRQILQSSGFTEIRCQSVRLETAFHMIVATRP